MAHGGAVDTDLMRSARAYLHIQQCNAFQDLSNVPLRFRRSASWAHGRHFLPINRVPTHRRFHHPRRFLRPAVDQGKVVFPNLSLFELPGQSIIGKFTFCHDQRAGGVLVQAVDNARAGRGPHGPNGWTPMKKAIDKGTRGVSRGGMNDHPRWFVYHQDMGILKQNGKRDRFGCW
jgi:hypothetical protein